ncbi:hypothetical protein CCUS01_04428 [Colletotrichum cuscutae]|uniref:Uncharacterized protein n=1 Tax=Colletotrichum cuscutae TaxID=1209917 RepID=A0AAI9VCM1_9PEZI|nr:hypothetical protein CCUS01_04428 [Colletotrichum cuscutae]
MSTMMIAAAGIFWDRKGQSLKSEDFVQYPALGNEDILPPQYGTHIQKFMQFVEVRVLCISHLFAQIDAHVFPDASKSKKLGEGTYFLLIFPSISKLSPPPDAQKTVTPETPQSSERAAKHGSPNNTSDTVDTIKSTHVPPSHSPLVVKLSPKPFETTMAARAQRAGTKACRLVYAPIYYLTLHKKTWLNGIESRVKDSPITSVLSGFRSKGEKPPTCLKQNAQQRTAQHSNIDYTLLLRWLCIRALHPRPSLSIPPPTLPSPPEETEALGYHVNVLHTLARKDFAATSKTWEILPHANKKPHHEEKANKQLKISYHPSLSVHAILPPPQPPGEQKVPPLVVSSLTTLTAARGGPLSFHSMCSPGLCFCLHHVFSPRITSPILPPQPPHFFFFVWYLTLPPVRNSTNKNDSAETSIHSLANTSRKKIDQRKLRQPNAYVGLSPPVRIPPHLSIVTPLQPTLLASLACPSSADVCSWLVPAVNGGRTMADALFNSITLPCPRIPHFRIPLKLKVLG